jgi:orotidine-5'-phosphate decarboxylase
MAEVIVALDLATGAEALELVDRLSGLRWAKVGPVLFVREGPVLVKQLKSRGVKVFLDLKWHDIPTAVAGAAGAAAALGADLATVHALGGRAMLEAAVAAAGAMRLAGVTVLTSHGPAEYRDTVGRGGSGDLGSEARRLARLAVDAGVHAVVASPLEVEVVREVCGPDRWVVVPGIRPVGSAPDDQRRAADPQAAVRAGATHLVVGRPITRAEDPRAVYDSLCEAAS